MSFDNGDFTNAGRARATERERVHLEPRVVEMVEKAIAAGGGEFEVGSWSGTDAHKFRDEQSPPLRRWAIEHGHNPDEVFVSAKTLGGRSVLYAGYKAGRRPRRTRRNGGAR